MKKSSSRQGPVVFVVGPTGAGKSNLALKAAEGFSGVIVNSDSVQVYQRVDIGTAKPTLAERQRRPHFLFDFVAPGESYTAGQYRRQALDVIKEQIQVAPVFVVGGSGFYVQALEKGMYSTPEVAPEIREQVRQEAESGGLQELYEELCQKDSEYAARISGNDTYRVQRAISVIRAHGRSLTEIQKEFEKIQKEAFPYSLIKLGVQVERGLLRERVRRRTQVMLDQGLVDEVKALLEEGLGEWAPLQSVGYKETVAYLRGELTLQGLEDEIVKNTMRLAKRQMTWFRRDPDIQWFDGLKEEAQAISFLHKHFDKVY